MIKIDIAEDQQGNPIMVPGNTKKCRVAICRPGKPGRRAYVYVDNRALELTLPIKPDDLNVLPDGDYCFYPLDENERRIGKSFVVSVVHLGGKPQPDADAENTSTNDISPVNREIMKVCEELRAANREMHENMLKAMETMRKSAEETTKAQVELTKHLAEVVEASARNVDASHGAGLSKAADELQRIWNSAPDAHNNLETVLKSPLVVQVFMGIQKIIANLVANAAPAVAGGGEPSQNRAAQVARAVHKARAARGE